MGLEDFANIAFAIANPHAYQSMRGYLDSVNQKEAAPVLQNFQKQYEGIAGQGAERFASDPASLQVMKESGLQFPTSEQMQNPHIAQGIEAFKQKSQNLNDLTTMGLTDPEARIMSQPQFTTHGAALRQFMPQEAETTVDPNVQIGRALQEFATINPQTPEQSLAVGGKLAEKYAVKPQELFAAVTGSGRQFATVKPEDTANREAYRNIDYLTRETTPEGVMQRASELSDVTGAKPEFVESKMQAPALKQFETVKPIPTATDEQLIARALKGDKEAAAILDEKDRRLAKRTQTNVTIKNAGKSANVNINGLSEAENEALSRAIDNGLDPYKINSRTAKIYAQQELKTPGRKWNELGAQAAFERNSGVMNTKALLNTIDPLLQKLEVSGAVLGNSSLPGYNKAVNYLKEATGRPDIVGFNNLRDDVVAEVERGLMGSGVLSDSKYNRAIKNINSAQSLPQLKAAIANTKTVIRARLESLAKGPNSQPSTAPSGGRFKILKVE